MTDDWVTAQMDMPPVRGLSWLRVAWRAVAFASVVYGGLMILLLLRLLERPVFGMARPWTPFITQGVCKTVFRILQIPLVTRGQPMAGEGAIVANHASWLDIFAINACARVYFVAKSEVEHWAAIGWLARATGTVFIRRKEAEAKKHQALLEDRLRAGHRLVFFPEGTSTDSQRVLPFKTTLFQAFFTHGMEKETRIQPVSLIYHAPSGRDARFYGWWGEMGFAGHLLQVLACARQGQVEVVFHPALEVSRFENRKALAAAAEAAVRSVV